LLGFVVAVTTLSFKSVVQGGGDRRCSHDRNDRVIGHDDKGRRSGGECTAVGLMERAREPLALAK
jgi:hypothetical protein